MRQYEPKTIKTSRGMFAAVCVVMLLGYIIFYRGLIPFYGDSIAFASAAAEIAFPPEPKPSPVRGKCKKDGCTKIILTIDDAAQSVHQHAFPAAQEARLPFTLFVPVGLIDTDWYMTRKQMKEQYAWGIDIEAHSIDHEPHTKLTKKRAWLQIRVPREWIFAELGYYPLAYATPEGDKDDLIIEMIKYAGYAVHTNAWMEDEDDINVDPRQRPFALSRYFVEAKHSPDTLCKAVQEAAKTPQWFILEFHSFLERSKYVPKTESDKIMQKFGAELPPENYVFVEDFKKVLQCIKTLQDDGEVEVVTMAELIKDNELKPVTLNPPMRLEDWYKGDVQ